MDFSTGTFRHGDILALGHFGTKTFQHMDVSALGSFGIIGTEQYGRFGTDINVLLCRKVHFTEMFQC